MLELTEYSAGSPASPVSLARILTGDSRSFSILHNRAEGFRSCRRRRHFTRIVPL